MAKPLWLVNLCLFALALALLYGIYLSYSEWQDGAEQSPPTARSGRDAEANAEAQEVLSLLQKPSLPISDFDIIVAKDTFKNPYAVVPRAAAPPPPPPLPPLPNLVGTMFVGDERRALLVAGDKTEIYTIGQAVAGGKLVAIEADRVVIERNGNRELVALKASLQPTAPARPRPQPIRPAPPQSQAAPGQPEAAEASPAVQDSPAPALPGGRTILRRSGR